MRRAACFRLPGRRRAVRHERRRRGRATARRLGDGTTRRKLGGAVCAALSAASGPKAREGHSETSESRARHSGNQPVQ